MRVHNLLPQKGLRQKLRNNMPKAEQILWLHLKGKQFEGLKFRRQHGIGRYVVDFYCPTLKLAIELDGASHFEEGAQKYDKERQATIEELGVTFIRFRNDQIYHNLSAVMDMLKEKVEEMQKLKK